MVLGGKKPSDKLAVIGNLLNLADRILIGGGMAYTFLAAQGYEVGNSVLEADQVPAVQGGHGRGRTARGRTRPPRQPGRGHSFRA